MSWRLQRVTGAAVSCFTSFVKHPRTTAVTDDEGLKTTVWKMLTESLVRVKAIWMQRGNCEVPR